MKGRPYSYHDVLSAELDALWLRSRDEADDEEPELVLAGVGREALVVTPARVYRLSAGAWPLADRGERAAVRPLADLVEARVREGFFLCRLNLGFASGEQMQLRVRTLDRDKMRLAARMLASLSLEAREAAREAAASRQAKAQAEAAAGQQERGPGRPGSVRTLPPRPAGAGADPAPSPAVGGDVVELLRGLWQLVEVGALTSAEYQAKKADLLGRV